MVVIVVIEQFGVPLSEWFQKMHDAIRDDEYLVGVELKDFQRPAVGTSSRTGTTTSTGVGL